MPHIFPDTGHSGVKKTGKTSALVELTSDERDQLLDIFLYSFMFPELNTMLTI